MEKLKFGIIGLGSLGQWYVNTIQQFVPEAELIAASSLNLDNLEMVESKFGIKQNYVDFREMLGLHELDAVVVTSDIPLRVRQAIEALDRGLHVLVACPIALNVTDCNKLIKKDDRYPNQVGMAGMVHRFSDIIQEAKIAIENGHIGELLSLQVNIEENSIGDENSDKVLRGSGSLFLDLGLQDIDSIRYLTGSDFDHVYTLQQNWTSVSKKESDLALAIGKLKTNQSFHLNIIKSADVNFTSKYILQGTSGTLHLEQPKWEVKVHSENQSKLIASAVYSSTYQQALIKQLNLFSNAILKSGKSPVGFVDAREAIRVSTALSKSLALNEKVKI